MGLSGRKSKEHIGSKNKEYLRWSDEKKAT
jgi:hypothetical protein